SIIGWRFAAGRGSEAVLEAVICEKLEGILSCGEGEAPAEPQSCTLRPLSRSFALPRRPIRPRHFKEYKDFGHRLNSRWRGRQRLVTSSLGRWFGCRKALDVWL